MIRDTVTYLCSDKRKTAAFGKFGFIFGEQKSTFTLSQGVNTVTFFENGVFKNFHFGKHFENVSFSMAAFIGRLIRRKIFPFCK